ncbi:hypothetical protein KIH74_11430 [Kineosporia sp. J2-2]|uniref:Clp amino terminal domain-containing protein, pathogenicity island component n=1 Tax=Kineosporia corallincola TaxID=2835133 RepID=A0ABS5TEQ7_9ACTN|nr:Clp protease N-terminal domain-containing protein [Kineosporia corallincola]MBT0769536.1 hypothetical protein [Kineosporia corallincola]
MTTTPFPGSDEFDRVWARACFHAGEVVGTHHLLRGLLHVPRIEQALDVYGVTPLVLRELVAREAPEPGSVERLLGVTVRPARFSNAAAAALDRCQARPPVEGFAAGAGGGRDERGAVDLLLAVLGDSQCRAVGILAECGVEIEELKTALREHRTPIHPDSTPVDLRRTRDALLGRTRYRVQGRGLPAWLRNLVAGSASLNYATQPVLWVRLEAGELARRQGRRMRSDDVLLALLTTYEVALAHPHLVGPQRHRYGGGRTLLAAGIDHDRVRAAMAGPAGPDRVPLPGPPGDWPQDTSQILERLVCVEGNHGARVLRSLGVDPSELTV